MKHEIGERIDYKCDVCGMETEHIVIKSTYTDTETVECLNCRTTDEYIV